ncbi:hypothetical protein HanRHA438_Chr17g0835161 [Helianthus annuus]|nr:hypothetical protein HanRHA438_Chr17g0835161 [Helianthus annuus]
MVVHDGSKTRRNRWWCFSGGCDSSSGGWSTSRLLATGTRWHGGVGFLVQVWVVPVRLSFVVVVVDEGFREEAEEK